MHNMSLEIVFNNKFSFQNTKPIEGKCENYHCFDIILSNLIFTLIQSGDHNLTKMAFQSTEVFLVKSQFATLDPFDHVMTQKYGSS